MSKDKVKGDVCRNRDCPTNKKTKPICQNCQVVMEETEGTGAERLFQCPKCGVTSRCS
jgi:predicted RNA-binding Zn-ribbon protein involved in translation (DUF1610 family)